MTALPFDAFLALLRSRGYAVGVDGHLAVARLLEKWDRTASEEFADALAALLARSEQEVRGIRRLFQETYLVQRVVPPPPPPRPRRRRVIAGTAIAAALLAAALWWVFRPPRVALPPPSPTPSLSPPITTFARPEPVQASPPAPPELPAPPRRLVRGAAAALLGGGCLLGLTAFWAAATRYVRRAAFRDSWSTALGALPGPYHFPWRLRDPALRTRRTDVEDAATILGRAIATDALASELDVRRSVDQTVRRGLMPTLVFKPRRAVHPVVVVEDIGDGTGVWQAKVEAFLGGLRRQGIALERWYFESDLRRLGEKPRAAPIDFDTVLRRKPAAPVLIVSDGAGLAATLAAEGNEGWLRTLRGHERRTWLNPVSDARLWPAELASVPVNVWPMTPRGLLQAARDLAGVDTRPLAHERAAIVAEERVALDDIERVKRLASLVPHPALDLVELLRRRFAPDVSDAVVLHLLAEAGLYSSPVLRLRDDEVKRCVAVVRHETPHLEEDVRRALVEILKESEPAPSSAAHLRWQLAVSLQQVALADLSGSRAPEAEARLAELSRGPLWEEVRHLARLDHGVPTLGRRLDAVLGAGVASSAAPPGGLPRGTKVRLIAPGIRELVPAALLSSLVALGAWRLGLLPAREIPHVANAYDLRHLGAAGSPGLLEARRWTGAGAPPARADLYQDTAAFRSGLDLGGASPAAIPLASADTGRHYQVRAVLPESNLALSPWVYVPSDRLVTVLIDASPWARVTITPESTASQTAAASPAIESQDTPLSAALLPGTYRLRFENDGLTEPLEQQITVAPSGPRAFRFTMPGFDPNRTASELLGSPKQ